MFSSANRDDDNTVKKMKKNQAPNIESPVIVVSSFSENIKIILRFNLLDPLTQQFDGY